MIHKSANDDEKPGYRAQVADEELAAYVAGTLPTARRTAVEGYLAGNPDAAAQMMTELHLRGRWREATVAAVAKPRRWRAAAIGGAACLASGMVGWAAANEMLLARPGEPDWRNAPPYVEDALESREATAMRETMRSQAETPSLDVAEVRRAMKLRVPALPAGWRVIDAQVYPSDTGPGLNLLVEPAPGRRLSLFAVRANTAVTSRRPVLAVRGRQHVVYWEDGQAAFVLSGETSGNELLAEARRLVDAASRDAS